MDANFCSNCGEAFEAAVRFCSKCGQANEKSKKVEEPSQVSQLVSNEVTNSKKTKGFKYALVIVLIALIGGGYFIIAPSRSTIDANKMTASQIMNWLIKNNYCSDEDAFMPEDSFFINYAKSYKNDEVRQCKKDNSRYATNANDYPPDWPDALSIRVQVNNGRFFADLIKGSSVNMHPKKQLNEVIGINWTLQFYTAEARYRGSYTEGKESMLKISKALEGKIASNYEPADACMTPLFNVELKLGPEVDVPADATDKMQYNECKKYFPEYMNLDRVLSQWKDM